MQIHKNPILIESIGNLLAYYHTDLQYIYKFQSAAQSASETDWIEYTQKGSSFASFLNEFRIARNVEKNKRHKLFKHVRDFVHSQNQCDVDILANELKEDKLTHKKTMISLASKILFLHDPVRILPFDKNTRQSLQYRGKKYSEFKKLIEDKSLLFTKLYEALPPILIKYLECVENEFEFPDPEGIRRNRFTDKILWTLGKNQKTLECLT